jgi:putative sugar O-methyltransferase
VDKILSLAMIVKNNEKDLKNCLESCASLFDEIIIVDTGSTDKTKEVALSYGAKVLDFEWIDDFAAARNYSFRNCTCPWILWLDSDDTIESKDLIKLQVLKKELPTSKETAYALRYNYQFNEQGKCVKPIRRNRIIRNDPKYSWIYPIHELLVTDKTCFRTDIAVKHNRVHSYDMENVYRNIRILEKASKLTWSDTSHEGRIWHFLAREYMNIERYKECHQIYKDHLNIITEDIIQSATFYYAFCCMKLGDMTTALQLCKKGIKRDSRFAEFYCMTGRVHYEKGEYGEARKWYGKAIKMKPPLDVWDTVHMEYYDEEPRNMIRVVDFQLSRPPISDISFLLPVHESPKSRELMPQFLKSWKATKSDTFGTLVVMNNGCEDWLHKLVEESKIEHVRIIDLGSNLGFIGAINEGIKQTEGPYVGFLNTDVTFNNGEWMPSLIQYLRNHEEVGACGFNCRGYKLKGSVRIGWLEFSCVLVNRDALEDVGAYLNTAYGKGYFDDDDLCLRLLRKNYDLAAFDNRMINHPPHQSSPDCIAQMATNYLKFQSVWEPLDDPFIKEYLRAQREFFETRMPWIFTQAKGDDLFKHIRESNKPVLLTFATGADERLKDWIRSVEHALGENVYPVILMNEPYFHLPNGYIIIRQEIKGQEMLDHICSLTAELVGEDKWIIFSPVSTTLYQGMPEIVDDCDGLISNTELIFEQEDIIEGFEDLIGKSIYNHESFIFRSKFFIEWLRFPKSGNRQLDFNKFLQEHSNRWLVSKTILSLHGSLTLGTEASLEKKKFVDLTGVPYPIVHANTKEVKYWLEEVKPKFGAVIAVLNEEDTIGLCLKSIYPYVDKIVITTSEYTWAGEKVELDRTLDIISEFPDPYDKIHVINGKWDRDDFARNDALNYLQEQGFDWALIVDGDEVWDGKDLNKLKSITAYYDRDAYRCSWYTYWKDYFHRIDPPETFQPIVMVKVSTVRFTWIREAKNVETGEQCTYQSENCIVIPSTEVMLHHFSYSHSDAKTKAKVEKSPHAKEFVPNWYEKVWLAWNENMEDLHPTNPSQYKRAVYSKWENLPEVVREIVPEPPKRDFGVTIEDGKTVVMTGCSYTPGVERWVESLMKAMPEVQPVIIMYEPYFEVPEGVIVLKQQGRYPSNVGRFLIAKELIESIGPERLVMYTDCHDVYFQSHVADPAPGKVTASPEGLLFKDSSFWKPYIEQMPKYSSLLEKEILNVGFIYCDGKDFLEFMGLLFGRQLQNNMVEDQLIFNEWLYSTGKISVDDRILTLFGRYSGVEYPEIPKLNETIKIEDAKFVDDKGLFSVVHANGSTKPFLDNSYYLSKKRPIKKEGMLSIGVVVAFEHNSKWHGSWPLIDAFRKEHSVRVYNVYNERGQYDFNRLNEALKSKDSYDFILILDIGNIRTPLIHTSKYPGILMGEMGDDPQRFHINLACASQYDVLLTPDFNCVDKYKARGWNHVHWFTHFYDQTVHKPYEGISKDFDVVTSMNMGGPRSKTLEMLSKQESFAFKNFVGDYGEDYSKSLQRGKIVFNQSNHNELTRRVFETLACGQFLLTDKLSEDSGLYKLFTSGEHFVEYSSEEELLEKIKYYLEHEEERQGIAEAGYKAVQEHSAEGRAKSLIEVYKKSDEKPSLNYIPTIDPVVSDIIDFYAEDNDNGELSFVWLDQIKSPSWSRFHDALIKKSYKKVAHILQNFRNNELSFEYGGKSERADLLYDRALEVLKIQGLPMPDKREFCHLSNVGSSVTAHINGRSYTEASVRHYLDGLEIVSNMYSTSKYLEIGGGFGDVLSFVVKKGFQAVDCDLPLALCVSYYYLKKALPEASIKFFSEGSITADALLLPTTKKGVLKNMHFGCAFNSYSLAEMLPEVVLGFVGIIDATCDAFIQENYIGHHRDDVLYPCDILPFLKLHQIDERDPLDPLNCDGHHKRIIYKID